MTDTPSKPSPDDAAPGSPLAQRVQGVVMIAVLALGFWQGVAALMTPAAERRLAPTLNRASLLAGQTASAVNYALAHYLPADGLFRAAGGVFRWELFRSGGPQVAAGCDGWLFLTEELRPWPDADAAMRARADTLGQVAARLKAKNIDLIVALVPDKARVEAAALCRAPRAAQTMGRYAAFATLLQERGVATVDLNAPFTAATGKAGTEPVFWRTDTHWSQTGAALAARTVAEAVRTSLGREYAFQTDRDAAETDGPGDLLRLMSLDKVPNSLRPRPDRQHLEHTVQTAAPAESGGLLDEGATAEVALVGSSFSLNANFHGRLQEALRSQVGNFGEAGGGFASSARAYFTGAAFRESPPKLVVWELPERFVGQPLGDADRTLLDGW